MQPATLPDDWNLDQDLLVVIGQGAEAQVAALQSAGLRRGLAIVPEGLTCRPVAGVVSAQKIDQLKPFVWANNTPLRRISMRLAPDGGVNHQLAKQWLQHLSDLAEQHRSFHATMAHLGPMWSQNGFANGHHVAKNPMIGDYGSLFADVPLIVVGSGPSLGRNIETLRQAEGKAIILATHRALESLHRQGIRADLTIAVEPRDVKHQFEGVGIEHVAASLLSTAVHPNLQQSGAKRSIYYTSQGREEWLLDPQDRCHEALSLGTVSHSAVSVAKAWGCDPIILVGQDLAFPNGAVYHAEGADGGTHIAKDAASGQWKMAGYSPDRVKTLKEVLDTPFDVMDVPGYAGGVVPTSVSFNEFRRTLEQMAESWRGQCQLINATEGGAKIEGWLQRPLHSVLSALPHIGLNVDARLDSHDTATIVSERGERIETVLSELHGELKRVVDLSRRCNRLLDQCIQRPSPDRMAKLEPIETALKHAAKPIAPLTLATQHDLTVITSQAPAIKDLRASLRLCRRLYAAIGKRAQEILNAQTV